MECCTIILGFCVILTSIFRPGPSILGRFSDVYFEHLAQNNKYQLSEGKGRMHLTCSSTAKSYRVLILAITVRHSAAAEGGSRKSGQRMNDVTASSACPSDCWMNEILPDRTKTASVPSRTEASHARERSQSIRREINC